MSEEQYQTNLKLKTLGWSFAVTKASIPKMGMAIRLHPLPLSLISNTYTVVAIHSHASGKDIPFFRTLTFTLIRAGVVEQGPLVFTKYFSDGVPIRLQNHYLTTFQGYLHNSELSTI